MPRLNDLTIEQSEYIELPDEPVFRWIVYHVKELFLYLLPPKFELDGSSKFVIACGSSGPDDVYEKMDPMFGVSQYYVEDFDFRLFFSLSASEQEEYMLSVIEKVMFQVVKFDQEKIEQIKQTVRQVRELHFKIEYEITKLAKSHRSKGLKIKVMRSLSKDKGDAWRMIIFNAKTKETIQPLASIVMNPFELPGYVDQFENFRKSRINDNRYEVYDHMNELTFSHDLSAYEPL